MTAEDPLHVEFDLPDERSARVLDLMIAREADGDPDKWLAGVIDAHRERARAEAPARFAELCQRVQEHIAEAKANPGRQRENAEAAKNYVPRPRRSKARAAWRTQPAAPPAPVDDYLAIVGSAEEVERRFHKHLKALPVEVRSRCADALAVQSRISGKPVTEAMVASLIARMTAQDGTTVTIGAQESASPERIAHAFANDIRPGDTILRFHDPHLAAVVEAVESLPDGDGRCVFRVVLTYEQRPVAATSIVMDRTTSTTVLRPQTPD